MNKVLVAMSVLMLMLYIIILILDHYQLSC